MTCIQRFSKREEVYDLGMIVKRPSLQNCPREDAIYVFYRFESPCERHDGAWVSEETVSFLHESIDTPLLDDDLQPMYQSHPYLTDFDNFLAVVKRTASDGTVRRYVEVPPAISIDGRFHYRKHNISKWDPEVKARLAELPAHVRDVFGI